MSDNLLVGKTIKAIYIAEDKAALRFDIEGASSPLIVRCDGDCCSSTWVENIENAEAAIGSPVLEAVDIKMPDEQSAHPEDKDRDVVAYYGFRIRTAKGDCVLDYRNESNGYYGGSLVWPGDDYFYGGVFGQNVSKEQWALRASLPAGEPPR